MKLPEKCGVCTESFKNHLDVGEIQEALKKEFGNKVFVEINGIMYVSLGENVDLMIDSEDMKMSIDGTIKLQSHDPMEGEPDFDGYIACITMLPKLSALLLKKGFSPVEWGVNELRGPGNGICSILMSKPITTSTVEALVEEVLSLNESLRKLDS